MALFDTLAVFLIAENLLLAFPIEQSFFNECCHADDNDFHMLWHLMFTGTAVCNQCDILAETLYVVSFIHETVQKHD
jgi:hypothetical protein